LKTFCSRDVGSVNSFSCAAAARTSRVLLSHPKLQRTLFITHDTAASYRAQQVPIGHRQATLSSAATEWITSIRDIWVQQSRALCVRLGAETSVHQRAQSVDQSIPSAGTPSHCPYGQPIEMSGLGCPQTRLPEGRLHLSFGHWRATTVVLQDECMTSLASRMVPIPDDISIPDAEYPRHIYPRRRISSTYLSPTQNILCVLCLIGKKASGVCVACLVFPKPRPRVFPRIATMSTL
jgi:hypothetical protein